MNPVPPSTSRSSGSAAVPALPKRPASPGRSPRITAPPANAAEITKSRRVCTSAPEGCWLLGRCPVDAFMSCAAVHILQELDDPGRVRLLIVVEREVAPVGAE